MVPESSRTPALCLAAVLEDGLALQFVPEAFRTAEICLEGVRRRGWMLEHVPEDLKTYETCMVAVKEDGLALKYVPEALRTPELSLAAVKANGLAIEFVPGHLLAPSPDGAGSFGVSQPERHALEMCWNAVDNFDGALEFVPEGLKTLEMCARAYSQRQAWDDCWKDIPERFRGAIVRRFRVEA